MRAVCVVVDVVVDVVVAAVVIVVVVVCYGLFDSMIWFTRHC